MFNLSHVETFIEAVVLPLLVVVSGILNKVYRMQSSSEHQGTRQEVVKVVLNTNGHLGELTKELEAQRTEVVTLRAAIAQVAETKITALEAEIRQLRAELKK